MYETLSLTPSHSLTSCPIRSSFSLIIIPATWTSKIRSSPEFQRKWMIVNFQTGNQWTICPPDYVVLTDLEFTIQIRLALNLQGQPASAFWVLQLKYCFICKLHSLGIFCYLNITRSQDHVTTFQTMAWKLAVSLCNFLTGKSF